MKNEKKISLIVCENIFVFVCVFSRIKEMSVSDQIKNLQDGI